MNAFPTTADFSVQHAAPPPLPESFREHLNNLQAWRQLTTAIDETERSWTPGSTFQGYSRSALSSFAKLQREYYSVNDWTDVVLQDDRYYWRPPPLIRPNVPASTGVRQGFRRPAPPTAHGHRSVQPESRIFVLRPTSELPTVRSEDGQLLGTEADDQQEDSEDGEEDVQSSHALVPDEGQTYRLVMVEKSSSGTARVKVEWASELIDRNGSYESWTAYRITSGRSELFLTANSEGRRTYRIRDRAGNATHNFATASLPTLTAPYEVPAQWGPHLPSMPDQTWS